MEVTGDGMHIWIRKRKLVTKITCNSAFTIILQVQLYRLIYTMTSQKRETNVSRQMKERRRIGSSRMCIRKRCEEDAEMRRYK
jgi:hypothetical protein